jgi:hypothetical protein
MSLEKTINYDNASNFDYDSNFLEFVGSLVRHKLIENTGNEFEEDFSDDTGHIYDSDKSEFVAGQNKQIDQRPDGYVLFDSFRKATEADWGSGTLTRTLESGAAIVDGETKIKKYRNVTIPNLDRKELTLVV